MQSCHQMIRGWNQILPQQRWVGYGRETVQIVPKSTKGRKRCRCSSLNEVFKTMQIALVAAFPVETTQLSSKTKHEIETLKALVYQRYESRRYHHGKLRRAWDSMIAIFLPPLSTKCSFKRLVAELSRIEEIELARSLYREEKELSAVNSSNLVDPQTLSAELEGGVDRRADGELKNEYCMPLDPPDPMDPTLLSWERFLLFEDLPEGKIILHVTDQPKNHYQEAWTSDALSDVLEGRKIAYRLLVTQANSNKNALWESLDVIRSANLYLMQRRKRIHPDLLRSIFSQYECYKDVLSEEANKKNFADRLTLFITRCLRAEKEIVLIFDPKEISVEAQTYYTQLAAAFGKRFQLQPYSSDR